MERYSSFPPFFKGQPYGNFPQYSSKTRIRVCQWQPVMPNQPRLVYPTQPMQIVSSIPTTPVVTIVQQSQAQTVVSQPVQIDHSSLQSQVSSQEVQVSQVSIQQPLVSGAQQQPQFSIPLSGLTQDYIGIVDPQLGQSFITGQQ